MTSGQFKFWLGQRGYVEVSPFVFEKDNTQYTMRTLTVGKRERVSSVNAWGRETTFKYSVRCVTPDGRLGWKG